MSPVFYLCRHSKFGGGDSISVRFESIQGKTDALDLLPCVSDEWASCVSYNRIFDILNLKLQKILT